MSTEMTNEEAALTVAEIRRFAEINAGISRSREICDMALRYREMWDAAPVAVVAAGNDQIPYTHIYRLNGLDSVPIGTELIPHPKGRS